MNDAMEPDDENMVELDPGVAASLRAVSDVDPVVRDSAIAAALAASDDARVVPIAEARSRRRVRLMSSLSAAAAAVVLVAVGVSVIPSMGGDDSGDMSMVVVEQANDEEPAQYEAVADESAADSSAKSALMEPSATEQPLAEATAGEAQLSSPVVANNPTPLLDSEAELIDQTDLFASQLSAGATEPPESSCVMLGGGPVGIAIYAGVEVVLFRDLASGTYTALSTTDCSTVVQVVLEP